VAAGSWLVATALLVAVPLADGADPTAEAAATPALGAAVWWLTLAVVTAQALVLLARRVPVRIAVLVVAAAAALAAALGAGELTGATSVAVLVAAFLTVVGEPATRAWPALAGAGALVAVAETVRALDAGARANAAVGGGLVQGLGTVGLAAATGVVVRLRREAGRARQERERALAREQAALVEVAAAHERTAIARELHDIAAHHLSGIAVMTGAIGRQIDTDPEGAKRAVREVRTQSTAMLRDLRHLVTLLREDPADARTTSIGEESLAGVAGLVDAARRAGVAVGLKVHEGAASPPPAARIGPLAQLAAYRTVQEALANVARHAPGAACVVVIDGRDARAVRVTVRNDSPAHPVPRDAPGGGFGLVGMRERADLTGARLSVGPAADGGWLVDLRLPTLDASAEPTQEDDR